MAGRVRPAPEDHVGDGLVGCFDVNEVKSAPDTRAPGIAVPRSMTVAATSGDTAVVKFVVSAMDFVDGERPVTCTPAAGTAFPVGANTVTCTSTDAAGNKGTAAFRSRWSSNTHRYEQVRRVRRVTSGTTNALALANFFSFKKRSPSTRPWRT